MHGARYCNHCPSPKTGALAGAEKVNALHRRQQRHSRANAPSCPRMRMLKVFAATQGRQRLFSELELPAMRSLRAIVIAVACTDNRRHAYTVRQAAAGAMLGLLLSAQAAVALGSMEQEVESLNQQTQIEQKLGEEGSMQRKQSIALPGIRAEHTTPPYDMLQIYLKICCAQNRKPKGNEKANLPFVGKKEDFDMVPVRDSQLEVAVKKIQGLSPYLDEVEYLISAKNWNYLQGFLGVFAEQETEFVDLIDGLYPTENPADQMPSLRHSLLLVWQHARHQLVSTLACDAAFT
eukprot:18799-Heterococcus_DN1.PRE.6